MTWVLCTAASSWVMALMLPLFRFELPVLHWILIFLGIALIGWAAVFFYREKTPVEPRKTPSALLIEGPFRINRNPIYTGMTLILAGFAVGLGALSAFIPVVTFPLLITERFIRDEEHNLRQTFGEKAESFFAGTRRW